MARTGLKAASGSIAAGEGATGAGIGLARASTGLGFGLAQVATRLGLNLASACVQLPAAVLERAGFGPMSERLRRTELALHDVKGASHESIDAAWSRVDSSLNTALDISRASMDIVRDKLTALAAQDGLYIRIMMGRDAQEMVLAVWALLKEFATPLADLPKLDLFLAAQAWAAAQQAMVWHAEMLDAPEVQLPEHCERWMRYTVAAFGAHRAGKLLDDPGAASRERWAAKSSALRSPPSVTSEKASASKPGPNADEDLAEERDQELHEDDSEVDDFIDPILDASQSSASAVPMPESLRARLATRKAAYAKEKLLLKALQLEEKRALRAARADEKQRIRAARDQGRTALKVAQASWNTPAGRGASALTCAGIHPDGVEVLLFEESSKPLSGETHVPGQMVAIDHVVGCVVVALRGSSCFRDALIDMDCKPERLVLEFSEGLAHSGMLRAARCLDEPLAAAAEVGFAKLSGPRRLVLCGHSLGAGVAALLALLWTDSDRLNAEVQCFAFGCPQVVDATLAKVCQGHTVSFVSGRDCVPCLSLATATDLRNALARIQDPIKYGLRSYCGVAELRAAAECCDTDQLLAAHAEVRQAIGSTAGRLYPSGRLIHLAVGLRPRQVDLSSVDELILSRDMVSAHEPRRYLAAVQAAEVPGQQIGPGSAGVRPRL